MNSWTRVIVEWANCLGIVESTIDSLHDLEDGVFYERLVSQLCRGNEENLTSTTEGHNAREPVLKFIRAEYPDFESVHCTTGIPEQLYTASLLLVQCSQQPMFHRPMCVALKNETQIQIKQFLEMILPCGKNLTKESIEAAITELGEAESDVTPSTPKVRPLRDFFNSPVVRSARSQRFMNDRNRELMCLRAQLETEQFEKADLLEDLKIQNGTISNLQLKLEEKTRELRELRIDRLRPPTPQSCRKPKRPSDNEERYRREAESLETINSELRSEIEKIHEEKQELARRLTSNERLSLTIREKYELSEKTSEGLTNQLEIKENELLDLRMNNEELRERIRQMQRLSLGEQSFDVEAICNEALSSSIVDIQLREARNESSQLKNELAELRIVLERALRDCDELRGFEIALRDKTSELDSIKLLLRDNEERLSSSNARATNLELEKSRLSEELTKLGAILREKDELLILTEKLKKELEFDVETANSRSQDLEISLNNEKSRITELKSNIDCAQRETANLRTILSSVEEKLSLVTREKETLTLNLDGKTQELRKSEIALNNQKSLVQQLETIVASCNEQSEDLRNKLASSQEQVLFVNENKKLIELNLESIVKKLETTETRLQNETARAAELESTMVRFNTDFNDLKNLLKSNEQLLNNERSKVEELKSIAHRDKIRSEDLKVMLEELKIALKNEKEASDELSKIVLRSKKNSQSLKSLLQWKDEILEEINKDLEFFISRLGDFSESSSSETTKSIERESKTIRTKKNVVDHELRLTAKEDLSKETEMSKSDVETELTDVKIIEIQSNLELLKTNISTVEEEKKRIILANKKLEEYARDADEKIVNVEIKISDYQRRVNNLEQLSTENRKELNTFQNELIEKNIALDSLTLRFSEMEKREIAQLDCLRADEKKIAELNELNEEMESQMKQEREKSTILQDDNKNLNENLSSYVRSTNDLREKIITIESELEKTRENLQKEACASDELRKKVKELRTTNEELGEKLTKETNQFTTVLSERDSLKDELSAYISETSIMRQQIEKLKEELEIYYENMRKESFVSDELRQKVKALQTINEELEEKWIKEKNQITMVLSERDILEDEVALYVTETSIMKEQIEKLIKELDTSHENLQRESSITVEMARKLEDLGMTNNKLEDKLTEEKNKYATILTERNSVKEELASNVNETTIMRQQIDNMEKELKVSASKLEKQIDENSALEKREHESVNLREKLHEELIKEREIVKSLDTVKTQLNDELSTFARVKADMIEELSALHKELEGSRLEQQNLRDVNDKECIKLRDRITKLTEESEQLMENTRTLEVELKTVKLERERLSEKIEVSSNTVTSLEKRLLVAENAREETKLEDKLKEEALVIVRSKLEQVGKEKIESELRMKEVILNLQEVRTSQDQVLEAQVQALDEKSRQLVNHEKELDELKNSLREKTNKLENESARLKNIEIEFDNLRTKSDKDSTLMEELQRLLDTQRLEICETTKNCESMKRKMTEIDKLSTILKIELNALWDSVRNACPELARPTEETGDSTEDAVASFVKDANTIRKAVSILGEANETLKERLDSEKETAKLNFEEVNKQKIELGERVSSMENELQKRDLYLSSLARRKKDLHVLLSRAVSERDKVDEELINSFGKWKLLNVEAQSFLTAGSSACDELKHLQVKRNELDDLLLSINERHLDNSKTFLKALCRIFLWSETKLHDAHNVSLPSVREEFAPESVLSEEIRRDEIINKDVTSADGRINEFSDLLKSYEASLKAGMIKVSPSNEEKLQEQLEKILKERKEIKDKLEAARVRNAKMEKNMDELRADNKKLKMEMSEATTAEEQAELERLRGLTEKLQEEKDDLLKRVKDERDVDARLETVHSEYGHKLEKIKQKMKTAYNEQMAKLNQEQEKAIKEKMDSLKIQMEQQCRKYTEDIAKYKAHISDLSSRYWDVGEKLLAETQEKQSALQQIQRMRGEQQTEAIAIVNEQITQGRKKTASLDRREFSADRATRDPTSRPGYRAVEVIEEETTTVSTRRHSVKSIQAMGNAFKAEDEEGEVFDSIYLADLKEGRCAPVAPDFDRLSELRMRNSMCRPHLKSSYAVETHLQPVRLNEDDIKNGITGDDVFNDSLSQSLLPGQKPKKKDRTQTSYKRPGPPTPSKNGGRLSLQGNELKSPNSRILKERNVDRRTTATPRGLKNLFGTSISKRPDENTLGTPKGRRLSNIFRKQRNERN